MLVEDLTSPAATVWKMSSNLKCVMVFIVVCFAGLAVFYQIFTQPGRNVAFMEVPSLKQCMQKLKTSKTLKFRENHGCLEILANSELCQDGLLVPKLVHYIFLGKTNFSFFFLLSILSSYRILKPGFIFVHTDTTIEGKWWDHLLDLVPNIVIIETEKVTQVFDKPVAIVQHQADVMRIQILLKFGGIYMDSDELALKSFDPLRIYPITMGHCRSDALGVQAIIASKHSKFLKIWYLTYKTFTDKSWAQNSQYMPYKLSLILPDLIHTEGMGSFAGFSGGVTDFFTKTKNWSGSYGLHLYIRLQKVQTSNPEHIKTLKSTYGEIARFIYYRNKNIIS